MSDNNVAAGVPQMNAAEGGKQVRLGKDTYVVQGDHVFQPDGTYAGRVGQGKFTDLGKTNLQTVSCSRPPQAAKPRVASWTAPA